jgi:glucosyl-dolichyl phosphate glucuronosyltransferase
MIDNNLTYDGQCNTILITIALTRYKEPDWLLNLTLESIARQGEVRAKVHVLDQSFHQETKDFCKSLCSESIVFEYHVILSKGCSYARNVAISLCQTDILLWTDPDVVLASDWAYCLSQTLVNKKCAIVGGKIIPRWHGIPRWYMRTNVMTDQYSLIDLGQDEKETDRIIGGSLGINIRQLGQEACFDENLGRRNGTLLGGVDAEFCERAVQHGFKVYYTGRTVAEHQILRAKMSLLWTARKFYYGGFSRSMRGGRPSAMNKKRETADYIVLGMFAPFYAAGFSMGLLKKRKQAVKFSIEDERSREPR